MNIENLTIGEARQIAAMFPTSRVDVPALTDHGWSIVVADRGFVYVGNVETDANWCVIEQAGNIRRWGTTGGLAQLCTTGPTKDTAIDWFDDLLVRIPMSAVISVLQAGDPWKH